MIKLDSLGVGGGGCFLFCSDLTSKHIIITSKALFSEWHATDRPGGMVLVLDVLRKGT